MKKWIGLILLLCVIGVTFLLITKKEQAGVTSEKQAIQLVKNVYPEYKDYPSHNLPLTSVEAQEINDGWQIGMYVEGSGLPGIVQANCFLVTRVGIVQETGFFHGEGPATSINLHTCTPKE
jgi:hypothetical protein